MLLWIMFHGITCELTDNNLLEIKRLLLEHELYIQRLLLENKELRSEIEMLKKHETIPKDEHSVSKEASRSDASLRKRSMKNCVLCVYMYFNI